MGEESQVVDVACFDIGRFIAFLGTLALVDNHAIQQYTATHFDVDLQEGTASDALE